MAKTQQGIFIPVGRKIWSHEMRAASILADAGYFVEFIKEGNLPSPDILLDGVPFEIKSPEKFNANTLEHTLKDALKQSPNIIVSTCRMKIVNEKKLSNFLIRQMRSHKQIKRILLIMKQGQIIDIKSLF